MTNALLQPYRKQNDERLYINTEFNHPPTVIKQIPAAINRRLSPLSSNKQSFDKNDKAFRSSWFNESLHYCKKNATTPAKNKSRNIIWFNPPYSKNVQTNVAKTFLDLIKKHFPPKYNIHPVFNKNNVKVSYSCMPNMGTIINNHKKKILVKQQQLLHHTATWKYANRNELAKHIWKLKDNKENYNISWSIISSASGGLSNTGN